MTLTPDEWLILVEPPDWHVVESLTSLRSSAPDLASRVRVLAVLSEGIALPVAVHLGAEEVFPVMDPESLAWLAAQADCELVRGEILDNTQEVIGMALRASRLVVRRGFDLVEGGSSAADFCDDLFGGLVPDEGLGVVVPVFGPDLDGIDEVGHAGEHASA